MARVHWIDVLIAPLTWLARARGRRRLALLALYTLVLGAVGVLVGREARLWAIPDAPEPFDLAGFGHVELADADNAMVPYRRAAKLRVNMPEVFRGLPKGAGEARDWRRADPHLRPWLEANRPALAAWLEGAGRPDALLAQPAELSSRPVTDFGVLDGLDPLGQLAGLEATRRQAAGDLAGAWAYHRAAIRSGLHATRHAGLTGAAVGNRAIRRAIPGASAWADEPGMTPGLLRAAIADLAACRRLDAPDSAMIRVEYFALRDHLGDRNAWEQRQLHQGASREDFWPYHFPAVLAAKYFWDNEPGRSRRILRLVTLGHLAQCDRPASARPAVASQGYLIYARDPTTPPPLDRVRPERLAAWADASGCRDALHEPGWALAMNAARRAQLDALRLRLAERAYALEHGDRPSPTYGALVPAYLDALPEGVAPGDPLAAP